LTAQQFNQAEIQRLLNKGIDVNGISWQIYINFLS
jgi:hypothetical protein